jgi:4-amino-4-deoxy-L-arabinose transferase-like glycosyltransferase
MNIKSTLKSLFPFFIVLALTIFLHIWAVSLLPQDYDEPVYLQNGFDYAAAFRSGSIKTVIDYSGTMEHPALVKLLYGLSVLALGDSGTWVNAFYASRAVSAFFGVLAVLVVSLLDPLAGGFLAVNTLAVKYTSQVYLEAIPQAMTIAAVLAFLRVDKGKHNRWFWISAIALGIAAASKYSYIPVILIVLLYLAVFEKKTQLAWLVVYGGMVVITFFAFDIHLWRDPFHRIVESLTYHVQYSQSSHVQEVGYPWYQPFIWIFTSSPSQWHPDVFFYYGFDGIFAIFAILGLKHEWKERRWLVVWFVAGLLFLLLWPTKWPQYALTVTPAICIISASTVRRFWRWLKTQESYWEYARSFLPAPTKWLWLAIGIFVLFIVVIYLSAAIKLAVGRIGWISYTTSNSSLPSNTINDLISLSEYRMLIATENGAAVWSSQGVVDEPKPLEMFSTDNSGLCNNDVLSLAVDSAGNYWFGTSACLSRFDGSSWTTYRTTDLGLPDETILSLATNDDGYIFAGTLNGAAVFNKVNWMPIKQVLGEPVFSIAFSSGTLWMAIPDGIWQIRTTNGYSKLLSTNSPVQHIMFDSSGELWAATSGSGLAHWDGIAWHYFTTGNSGIPGNSINWVTEIQPGILWVATAYPNTSGGILASFNGKEWHSFLTNNSGASGSEPLVIVNAEGLVWSGTRSRGIDIYKLGR